MADENTVLHWKVHTPNLLKELVENNPSAWACRIPVTILQRLLIALAVRASVVDDPELNALMLRLQLYDVDPLEVDKKVETQLARDGKWQDIKTAPKDRAILLTDVNWPVDRGHGAPVKVGGWYEDEGRWNIFGASWDPTHWQPLPTPPRSTRVRA